MQRKPPICTAEESGAFTVQLRLEPTAEGPLSHTTFAVKDVIDVAGTVTGRGSPAWTGSHAPAPVNAVVVDMLLDAGAACVGKTHTDEMTFGMDGENPFHGTPVNPAAPDRIPGGSSSGSASAVACGLADFALATDTGGSARMPASHCGLLGYRPSHGRFISAGVGGLVPSFDTAGLFARDPALLEAAASVLAGDQPDADARPGTLLLLMDAFELCDPAVGKALLAQAEACARLFAGGVRKVRLEDLAGPGVDLNRVREIFLKLQGAEVWSYFGEWIARTNPEFGERIGWSFAAARKAVRTGLGLWHARREAAGKSLNAALGEDAVLCLPTVPREAPLKGSLGADKPSADYYRRSLSLTSVAGVGRMPQVTLPLAAVDGAPVGLSLVARRDRDMFLLAVARQVMESR